MSDLKKKINLCFTAVPLQQECWSVMCWQPVNPKQWQKHHALLTPYSAPTFLIFERLVQILSSCRCLPFSHTHTPTDRQVVSTSAYARSCCCFTLQMCVELVSSDSAAWEGLRGFGLQDEFCLPLNTSSQESKRVGLGLTSVGAFINHAIQMHLWANCLQQLIRV